MKITIIPILLLLAIQLAGQIKATTTDGKKVILREDWTWKYQEVEEIENIKNSDCDKYVLVVNDKMTGSSHITSLSTLLISQDGNKTGLGIGLLYSKEIGSLIITITAIGGGNCIDDTDQFIVLFRDGTRIALKNNGDFNCDNNMTLYLGGDFSREDELKALTSKEVETIRVTTVDSVVQEDFTKTQSQEFMKTMLCIFN